MTSAFGRISENTLFSLLIAAFVGWVALSTVSAATASSSVALNAVAQSTTTCRNS